MIYLILNLGFSIIFFLLGGAMILLHTPKDEGMKNYRICRYLLGGSYLLMSIYCIIRLIVPQSNDNYGDFWFLVTFTLLFMWLNYTAFLFFINSERKITRSMIIDGIVPVAIICCVGGLGYLYPGSQKALKIIFTLIYTAKAVWMFLKAIKEWKICHEEISATENIGIDIRWMKNLLIVIFIYSLGALTAFYLPSFHIILGPMLLAVFTYQTFKIINFMPMRLDAIRRTETKEETSEKPARNVEFADRIRPKVDAWVAQKKFCRPDITIREAAQEMGTNHNYLSAYINEYLDMTFQTWLNTLRIEEAKILLLKDYRMSIEDIGISVGIPQNYNFSRWFKTITDMTPYQFRKSNAARV